VTATIIRASSSTGRVGIRPARSSARPRSRILADDED
jgi:hypothetical protein